ncbi:MAG: glycerol-3-phosphate dehydrogenase subunit GlpB [Desulfovermiculus sp.]
MSGREVLTTQTTVIGTGLAGMAAALFGAEHSVQTALIGSTGASEFSSGMIDLFGALPRESLDLCLNPWEAIERLPEVLPRHPYTLIDRQDIQQALGLVTSILKGQGLFYAGNGGQNHMAVGPLGTLKPTYLLPSSMLAGVQERVKQSPGLIVDFYGLKDFSAKMAASNLEPLWPGLRTSRVSFPGCGSRSELFTELLAYSLESPHTREELVQGLRPLLQGVQVLGLPAVLGVGSAQAIHRELEERLEVRIFEIPTIPASVPGLRLTGALKRAADASPFIRVFDHNRVTSVDQDTQGRFVVTVQGPMQQWVLKSRALLLATGRFLGQGLTADRKRIKESLLDLPVHQPDSRAQWHREDFFDPKGHALNQAGIEVDEHFRPVDGQGRVVYKNLYAAGSILAHQDWMRFKCGAGLAIASAYKASHAAKDA